MTWHDDAACKGMGQTIFFPVKGQSLTPAKTVCAGCPVREECLTVALEDEATGHRFGVRGGMSPRERDEEARRRRIQFTRQAPPCGTEAAYKRHRRAGEEACWWCREANRFARRARKESA